MTYVSYVDKQLIEGGDWSNFFSLLVNFWELFTPFF